MSGKHLAGAGAHEPVTPRGFDEDAFAQQPDVELDEDAEPYDVVPDPERTVALDDPAEVAEALVDAEDARRDGESAEGSL